MVGDVAATVFLLLSAENASKHGRSARSGRIISDFTPQPAKLHPNGVGAAGMEPRGQKQGGAMGEKLGDGRPIRSVGSSLGTGPPPRCALGPAERVEAGRGLRSPKAMSTREHKGQAATVEESQTQSGGGRRLLRTG